MSKDSSAPAKGMPKVARLALMGVGGVLGVLLLAAGGVFLASNSAMAKTYDVKVVPMAIPATPDLVEKGKTLATFRGCRDCHGENLGGRVVADAMPVMVLAAPNITPGGVTKGYTDEDWARAIRHGVKRDGTSVKFMPSYEWTRLSHGDLAAIIAYAKSVPPIAEEARTFEVGPLGRILYLAGELPLLPAELVDHTAQPESPTPGPTAEYGAYLATACIGCHGPGLSGGQIPGVPPEWPVAANLTAHETGLKDWTFEDFKTALKTGKSKSGKEIDNAFMPWKMVSEAATDDDLMALWEYTRTKPVQARGNR